MIERPDLSAGADPASRGLPSPPQLEVFQLTSEEVPSSHVYMEAQVFTPDSRHLILHRSAHPHGSDPRDAEHRYLVCDLVAGGALRPLTDELGATAPSIRPDGQVVYYFIDRTRPGGGGQLILKRVNLDGGDRQEVAVVDGPLPDDGRRASRPYPLSTVRADGRKVAISCFLGDGTRGGADWGLLVFDVDSGGIDLVLAGPSWCNIHPQYCRADAPRTRHDLLVQENHGNLCGPDGTCQHLTGGTGADIHLVRDDGTDLRDLPWGRDGNEYCQGHQCWIGATTTALTSTSTRQPPHATLVAGRAVPHAGHRGRGTSGGWRNDLTRDLPQPDFYHFATDAAGRTLIADAGPRDGGGALYVLDVPEDLNAGAAIRRCRYLLSPGSSWRKGAHIHPFLSPDGGTGFFNSDETGVLQAYMVRGWEA